ncbi:Intersectin-1, partial [Bienertia sinuspersici]
IFVPVHIGNHFTVLVFNFQKSMIEDIDNRSDNKSFAIYGEKPYDKVYELCHVFKVFCKVIESSVVVLMVFTIGIEGLFLLLGEVIKMTLIVVFIVLKLWNGLYKEFKSMSSCYRFGKLQREQKETGSFEGMCFVVARKPFLIQQQKKRKDKEKHLQNLRVKRVEKVFVEDEKIKKERERHEQE